MKFQHSATQGNLPGVPVKVPAAYRGREFEFLLDGLHDMYAVQKIAKMYRHPKHWEPCSSHVYNSIKDGGGAYTVARTAVGTFIRAQKSLVDYSGVIKPGIAVYFDAKQTKGKSLPLGNIHQHQVDYTLERERFGAIAGFMVWFTDLNRFFFLWASYVERCMTLAQLQNDRKSIAVAMCEENGREIALNKWNYPDWVSVLVPRQNKESKAKDE